MEVDGGGAGDQARPRWALRGNDARDARGFRPRPGCAGQAAAHAGGRRRLRRYHAGVGGACSGRAGRAARDRRLVVGCVAGGGGCGGRGRGAGRVDRARDGVSAALAARRTARGRACDGRRGTHDGAGGRRRRRRSDCCVEHNEPRARSRRRGGGALRERRGSRGRAAARRVRVPGRRPRRGTRGRALGRCVGDGRQRCRRRRRVACGGRDRRQRPTGADADRRASELQLCAPGGARGRRDHPYGRERRRRRDAGECPRDAVGRLGRRRPYACGGRGGAGEQPPAGVVQRGDVDADDHGGRGSGDAADACRLRRGGAVGDLPHDGRNRTDGRNSQRPRCRGRPSRRRQRHSQAGVGDGAAARDVRSGELSRHGRWHPLQLLPVPRAVRRQRVRGAGVRRRERPRVCLVRQRMRVVHRGGRRRLHGPRPVQRPRLRGEPLHRHRRDDDVPTVHGLRRGAVRRWWLRSVRQPRVRVLPPCLRAGLRRRDCWWVPRVRSRFLGRRRRVQCMQRVWGRDVRGGAMRRLERHAV
mmetsp:Transcript_1937/g.6186  ORF Transcript_1937/g.6186 Transcript_1937/m.6186 type:complete len:529 (+) Transcript_1937:708-2294(+)